MAESVAHFMREIGRQNMFEGDVYITNDPWWGTGHLHDITVVTPSFLNGVLVGYFACTAHITDIGGRGFGADANSVYEEGLQIPIMKFVVTQPSFLPFDVTVKPSSRLLRSRDLGARAWPKIRRGTASAAAVRRAV